MCWISIRPTTNMTDHNNTAKFCEIRKSVKILWGFVSHRVSTVYGFWWNIICSNCSDLCCGWILDYNLCEKIWQYRCVHYKAYFNVLFGTWKRIYTIVNGYHMKMTVLFLFLFFFRCCKYVVGQLWHSSIWNFLMKNKEKNQAHEELTGHWLASLCYIETGTVWLTQWLIFQSLNLDSTGHAGHQNSGKYAFPHLCQALWFACALDHMVVKEKWIKSLENQWSFSCYKQSQFITK